MHKVLLLSPMSSVHEKFNGACINALKILDAEIHLAANFGMDDHTRGYANLMEEKGFIIHDIPFVRSSLLKNFSCIKYIKRMLNTEDFDIIHAHTETGGLLLRVSLPRGSKSKCVFTPHGMSFWKGSSLKSQIIYKSIEKWICAGMDANIAINQEEYKTLQNWNACTSAHINGIGLNLESFRHSVIDVCEKKAELGLPSSSKVLLSIGELNDNKNHITILKALSLLSNLPNDFRYVICGKGENLVLLKKKAKELGLEDVLVLLGYRTDIGEILQIADYFAFPSFHEGLPVSVMEAMANGLPIVGSRIRGVTDLVFDNEGGFLYSPDDVKGFSEGLSILFGNEKLCVSMGNANKRKIVSFSQSVVEKEMYNIYSHLIARI